MIKGYEKFKWFLTSNNKLVIGGKSAEQNEIILKEHLDCNDIVLHTKSPGSPFCIIKGKANEKDIKEAAVFCACFSQGWKKQRKAMEVHIFKGEQLTKGKGMKMGTFAVFGRVAKAKVKLELWLGMQNGKLRAAPKSCLKEPLIKLEPGKVDKKKAVIILKEKLQEHDVNVTIEDIMQALPAGGFKL